MGKENDKKVAVEEVVKKGPVIKQFGRPTRNTQVCSPTMVQHTCTLLYNSSYPQCMWMESAQTLFTPDRLFSRLVSVVRTVHSSSTSTLVYCKIIAFN